MDWDSGGGQRLKSGLKCVVMIGLGADGIVGY